MDIRRVAVDRRVADPVLAQWDYGDAFRVSLPASVDPRRAARQLFRAGPTGTRVLRARDRWVRPLGLAPVAGSGATIFPVLSADEEVVVLGMDDRHLDFRVVLLSVPSGMVVTTLVRRHNILGHCYFAVVRPVHRRVVPLLLRRSRLHPGDLETEAA